MYTLKDIRSIVLNYLGSEQTANSLEDISGGNVTAFLNSEINQSYIYDVCQVFSYADALAGKSEMYIKNGEYKLDLSKYSKIESMYLDGVQILEAQGTNTSVYQSNKTHDETVTIGTAFKTNTVLVTETINIFQGDILVGVCDVKNNIYDPSSNKLIGNITRTTNMFTNTYLITSTSLSGVVEIKYKSIQVGRPSLYARYVNRIFRLNCATNTEGILTIRGSVLPQELVEDSDTTILPLNEFSLLIGLLVAYKIANRTGSDRLIQRLSTSRMAMEEDIKAKLRF